MVRLMNLTELCESPIAQRNEQWESNFLAALPHSYLSIVNESPQNSFDGWPYLFVQPGLEGKDEPTTRVLDWLVQKGVGLLISPEKSAPDYVLTYGQVWNFKETGRFISPLEEAAPTGAFELSPGAKILAGPPHEKYLPLYVRSILREFLAAQGVVFPRILVLSTDQKNFDLCFSIESLGNPPKEEHQGIAEALSWFLPTHYSVVLISEEGLPAFVAM